LPAEFPNEHIRPEIDEWDGDRLFAEVCSLVEAGVVAPSPGRALLTAPVKEDPFDDDDGTQRTLAFEGMCRAVIRQNDPGFVDANELYAWGVAANGLEPAPIQWKRAR
jgi:hypothetical protein